MKLLCHPLVWVRLDAQRLLDGQNFKKEGQIPVRGVECLNNVPPDEVWVTGEVF